MATQLEISLLREELQRREAEVLAWERLIHQNRDLIRHVADLQDALDTDPSVYWWSADDRLA